MKRLQLSGAMLGLTVLLTACPGPTPPPAVTTHTLTVKLDGVPSAPVTVTNATTKAQVFSGALEGSKTFGNLKAGDVFEVTGAGVNGHATPATQTVTLDADKTVTLVYTPQAGAVLKPGAVSGTVSGNDLKLGNVYLESHSDVFYARGTVSAQNSLDLDLSAFAPTGDDLVGGFFVDGCAGTHSNPTAGMLVSSVLNAYSPQGDLLGEITERVVGGADVSRTNAFIIRMYSDAEFTFNGTCTVPTRNGTVITWDVNVTLKRGWNAVTFSGAGERRDLRNAAVDTRVQLTFRAVTPSVSVRLDPGTLNFAENQTATVNARLTQVGGYSGTVALATNIPGLSIEPASVTLPGLPKLGAQEVGGQTPSALARQLTALSLEPQTVSLPLTFRYSGTENMTASAFTLKVSNASGQQVGQGSGILNVNRAGINLYANTSGFQVTPGSSGLLPVSVTSVGGFSGTVTVRLENLPAGVSATTRSVTLTANGYANGDLTLTGGAGLTPGEYTAALVAEGGGRSARSTVKIVVPRPSLSLSIRNAYNGVSVHQGAASSIEIDVTSQAGFSGGTTLTLTGLPAGVTSAPLTVQVTPGATTTVKVPLSAAADAPLGTSAVTVTSPDVGASSGASAVQLTVRPARTLLGGAVSALAPATAGVWTLMGSVYDSATGTYRTTLKRLVDGQARATVTLNGSLSRLLALPSGDVLAVEPYSAKALRIDAAGQVTAFSAPSGVGGGVADGQGRIWFVQSTSTGMGGRSDVLAHWTPETGEVVIVDAARSYNTSDITDAFSVSNNGKTIVYLPGYSGTALKIDTSTGAVSDLGVSVSPSGGSAVVSDSGEVWFTEYGALKRLNADGSVTTFTGTYLARLVGFDRAQPGVLWGTTTSEVARIDASSGAVTKIELGTGSTAATLNGGGLTALTSEYDGATGMSQTYLTVLR